MMRPAWMRTALSVASLIAETPAAAARAPDSSWMIWSGVAGDQDGGYRGGGRCGAQRFFDGGQAVQAEHGHDAVAVQAGRLVV
jgi:hypothetical protein